MVEYNACNTSASLICLQNLQIWDEKQGIASMHLQSGKGERKYIMKRKHTLLLTASILVTMAFLPGMTGSYIYAADEIVAATQRGAVSDAQMYKQGADVGKILFPLMETVYTDHLNEVVNEGSIELYNKCYDRGVIAIAKTEIKENMLKSLFLGSGPKKYTFSLLKMDGTPAFEGEYGFMQIDSNKNIVSFNSKDFKESGIYSINDGVVEIREQDQQVGYVPEEIQKSKQLAKMIEEAQETYKNDPKGFQDFMAGLAQDMQVESTYSLGGDSDIRITKDLYEKNIAVDSAGNKLFELPDGEFQPFVDGIAEYHGKISHVSGFVAMAAGLFGGRLGSSIGNTVSNMEEDAMDAETEAKTVPKPLSFVEDPFDNRYRTTLLEPLRRTSVSSRGYVTKEGKVLVDRETDFAYLMRRMGTMVQNKADKHAFSFIDRQGNVIITLGKYEPEPMKSYYLDDRAYLIGLKDIASKKMCAISLKDGTQVTPAAYERIEFLSGNRALFYEKERSLLVDVTNGKVVAEFPKKMEMRPFGLEEVAWLYGGGKYQIVNRDGEVLYTLPKGKFKFVGTFKHGFSVVGVSDDKYGIMDSHGNWVAQPTYADLELI